MRTTCSTPSTHTSRLTPAAKNHITVTRDTPAPQATTTPSLNGAYTLVADLRVILDLKLLKLSQFHVSEDGDWGFTISGNQRSVEEWIHEVKQTAKVSTIAIQSRSRGLGLFATGFLGLILGIFLFLLTLGLMVAHHSQVCSLLQLLQSVFDDSWCSSPTGDLANNRSLLFGVVDCLWRVLHFGLS